MEAATTQHSNASQVARVLRLLKSKGSEGATNVELNNLCYRYGARILELRNEGHAIVSVHEKGSLWRFVYKAGDE